MEPIIQNRSVDLQSNRYASVIIKQGDKDSRTVIFKLTDNGVPYIVPSGITVYLSGLRADGSAIIQKLSKNADGNYPYTFTDYDTTIYGRSKCEIKLVEDKTDKVLSSMVFVLVVEKSALSDQQIADAGDSRNLFKELVIALENAKNLQAIVDGLKDDVAGIEAIGKEMSDNEKLRQANEATRIQNEEERIKAELQRNTKLNESLSTLDAAIDSANELLDQVEQTDDTAQDTIKNLNDAIDRLNKFDVASMTMPEVSTIMPAEQSLKGLWFVAETSGTTITWENTENGDYAFVKSGSVWTSNNQGVNNSTAASTWEIVLDEDVEYLLKYRVSSEQSYDKFTLTLDTTTIIANGISGAVDELSYTASLKAGKHTLVAKYVKDTSQSKNDDCAYVILEPISVGDGTGAVRQVAVKVANNGTVADYQYHPIGTDSIYITRPNGKTVEESLDEIEVGGVGVSITVDDSLSTTSMNPIANKAVAEKIGTLETAISNCSSKITTLEGNTHSHANSNLLNALSYADGKLYYNGTLISGGTTTETHTHSNKSVLDLLSVSGGKLYYNGSAVSTSIAVDNSSIRFNSSNQIYAVNNHSHSNKSVLDALSASGGQLYYNGSVVGSSSSGDYVLKSKQDGNSYYNIFSAPYTVSLEIGEGTTQKEYISKIALSPNGINITSNITNLRDSINCGRGKVEFCTHSASSGYSNIALIHKDSPSTNLSYSSFSPTNGAISLGSSTNYWTNVYAQTGSIITSDRKEKKSIMYLSENYVINLIMGLKPCSYKLIDNTSDRTHNGMIAQDVEKLLESLGIDSKDFAAFIKYEKEEKDGDGNTVHGYGLRYEEFIAPLIKFVQYQQNKIEDLEGRIVELEN